MSGSSETFIHLCSVLAVLVAPMLGSPVLRGAPVLGSPVLRGAPVVRGPPEPIRCASCTPERLSGCPAVGPGCREVLREAGCRCCPVCALRAGEPCGIYTAPCGSGSKCTPRPGDPRPLLSLRTGQAQCAEQSPGPRSTADPGQSEVDLENTTTTEPGHPLPGHTKPSSSDPGSGHPLPGHTKPSSSDPGSGHPLPNHTKPADAQASMKATRKKQQPCHQELHRALDQISKSQQNLGDKLTNFYLPNCDKHGNYKAKQCESSLDGQSPRCWCLSPRTGRRTQGSADLEEGQECP
ncbi:hypothetical protein CRUP_033471 [Coryphaenoides rupestris]|nr:hypothetical protein CRUP_033471 [Coryphaenoides rupestris]